MPALKFLAEIDLTKAVALFEHRTGHKPTKIALPFATWEKLGRPSEYEGVCIEWDPDARMIEMACDDI